MADPLVSCIMPTFNRRPFVEHALRLFEAQDYPNLELIVIDDGAEGIADLVPVGGRVHYVRLGQRRSIGAKRNLACELAQGVVIVQWDDDDWYGPQRVTHQVADILAGRAEITGLYPHLMLDALQMEFWACMPELHSYLFVQTLHHGTLTFSKEMWARCGGYPDLSQAEDVALSQRAMRYRARVRCISDEGDFVYVRHGGNSWRFGTCGESPGWRRAGVPSYLSASDLDFYRSVALRSLAGAGYQLLS